MILDPSDLTPKYFRWANSAVSDAEENAELGTAASCPATQQECRVGLGEDWLGEESFGEGRIEDA